MLFLKFVLLLTVAIVAGLAISGCTASPEEGKTYEEYVDSLPEGCLPVPRECFEQALKEGQINTFEWAEWWPEEIYTEFEKEFGIKVVRDYFASEDEAIAKFKLDQM